MSTVASDARTRKPRKWLWIFVVAAFVLLGCGGMSGLLWFLYVRPAETTSLTDRELEAMVRFEDFVNDFALETPPKGTVMAKKEIYLDRAWTAAYEYSGDELYIRHDIDYEPKESDARVGFPVTVKATEWGFSKEEDVSLQEDKNFFDLGDERKFWRMVNENGVAGFVVILRKGKFIFSLTVTGIEIDRESFDRIIAPKVELMETALRRER